MSLPVLLDFDSSKLLVTYFKVFAAYSSLPVCQYFVVWQKISLEQNLLNQKLGKSYFN